MNYAWAHPITGIREQTEQSTPERMLAEAKRRVWEELQTWQELQGTEVEACPIWRQEPIGTVTADGPFVDPARVLGIEVQKPGVSYRFAWCDPEDGRRIVDDKFPGKSVIDQLERLQDNRDPTDTVILYATWLEYMVNRSDPMPEAPEPDSPAPRDVPEHLGSCDIDRRKVDLEEVVVLDDQTKIALHSAWALLDIAESLRLMRPASFQLGRDNAEEWL